MMLVSILLIIIIQSSIALNAIPPQLNVVPYPSKVELGQSALLIEPTTFKILLTECHADCVILRRAILRYTDIIMMPPGSTGTVFRLSIFENRINQSLPIGPFGKLLRLNVEATNEVLLRSFFIYIYNQLNE